MKWRTLIPVTLLALVLLVASACGGGGAEATPTPTPTPTQTSTPTVTPTLTPTPIAMEYPTPRPGKSNIAGHITWKGESYELALGKRSRIELYSPDALLFVGSMLTLQEGPLEKISADTEGYYLFQNIDPGSYYIRALCPLWSKYGGTIHGPVVVAANETFWVGEIDPYDLCSER